ncbi:MAG TPA: ABC transporter permease [Anaerolineales bacterium]|jgi:ABC-2 type transport system permease protein|nr:ABC transporter permease [Anaerolineales bacterium]
MKRLAKFLIRISSFISKELTEILRQPRLILTLVFGPFLIMFLFGLGYPEQNRTLRTTFVAEDPTDVQGNLELFTGSASPAIADQDMESNKELALAKLALNQTDLVIVIPPNPLETIENNEQAVFTIYHNEVDPFQIAYINSVARIYVDDVNRRLLQEVTEQGQANAGDLQTSLENAITKTQTLKQAIPPGDTSTAAQVTDLENDLTTAHDQLTTFRSLGSSVIVNPFNADTTPLSNIMFTPTEFFAPAVIVLLLQHLSITFASLSIVRERRSGIIELFRVAPISAFETLIGKFLSYLLFEILLAGVITFLAVWLLKVPMFGNWINYALAVIVLLFTSLGVGFLISLISQTDTQAVQYSMLLLLASIFFSGFFLDLRLMWEPMKVLAWSLPATYGIRMLQDVMLRGASAPSMLLYGLALIGAGLFFLDWFILRRRMEA